MIPQAYITAWRATVPWTDDAQVEQDLALSRAVVELFADPNLAGTLALRGGTALNKLFLPAPARYSEDIDLVQVKAGAIGPAIDAIRDLLAPWLGDPKRSASQGNMTLVYRFQSEVPPVRGLRLKVETNTREHFAVLGFQRRPLAVHNPWFTGVADVLTYDLNELMGTKLRALYQRRKGRDLFDLWLCLEQGLLNVDDVLRCFQEYMRFEEHAVSRAQYERNLQNKLQDPTFLSDLPPLLAGHIAYDAAAAMDRVSKALVERLPAEPWAKPRTG